MNKYCVVKMGRMWTDDGKTDYIVQEKTKRLFSPREAALSVLPAIFIIILFHRITFLCVCVRVAHASWEWFSSKVTTVAKQPISITYRVSTMTTIALSKVWNNILHDIISFFHVVMMVLIVHRSFGFGVISTSSSWIGRSLFVMLFLLPSTSSAKRLSFLRWTISISVGVIAFLAEVLPHCAAVTPCSVCCCCLVPFGSSKRLVNK